MLLVETYLRDHSSILCWWIMSDVCSTRKYELIKVEKAINLLLIRLTIDPDTLSMQNLALPNVSVCVSPTDDAVSRIRVQLFALFLFPLNLLFDDSWSHYDSSSETQFTGAHRINRLWHIWSLTITTHISIESSIIFDHWPRVSVVSVSIKPRFMGRRVSALWTELICC